MKYELVMGLEVHVELATESKLFCSCSAKFGADANEHVCPACCGMPGLPAVLNRRAIELAIAAGIVTNCEISRYTTFDKKNYFYPDLPTGYQITQLFNPICTNGHIDIETQEGKKSIRIKQIHVEEDAGKLVHDTASGTSLVDYNRASVPLVEVVSMPDFRSADEVIAYLEKLRALLTFAGVSDCRMQEGSMRADINISVREAGAEELGTRAEIKNMNSLKAIARAIEFETQRHIDALETGCEVLVQETHRWDDNRGESFSMREKENATDYRYFPNPDVMPVNIDEGWIERVRASLPELAHEKLERYTSELGLPEYDSRILTSSKRLSDIFDEIMRHCDSPKEASNWLIVELMNVIKTDGKSVEDVSVDGRKIARLIKLIEDKVINRGQAKKVFFEIYSKDADPDAYVKDHGLAMLSDEGAIRSAAEKALLENPKSAAEYRAGNEKVVGFLFGKVMRETGGKADPSVVSSVLKELLS